MKQPGALFRFSSNLAYENSPLKDR